MIDWKFIKSLALLSQKCNEWRLLLKVLSETLDTYEQASHVYDILSNWAIDKAICLGSLKKALHEDMIIRIG